MKASIDGEVACVYAVDAATALHLTRSDVLIAVAGYIIGSCKTSRVFGSEDDSLPTTRSFFPLWTGQWKSFHVSRSHLGDGNSTTVKICVANWGQTVTDSGIVTVQGGPKNWHHFLYALTSSNIKRFSKFFHCRVFRCQNQEKICNDTITKDLITPQVCRYTTLCPIKAPRGGILLSTPRPAF